MGGWRRETSATQQEKSSEENLRGDWDTETAKLNKPNLDVCSGELLLPKQALRSSEGTMNISAAWRSGSDIKEEDACTGIKVAVPHTSPASTFSRVSTLQAFALGCVYCCRPHEMSPRLSLWLTLFSSYRTGLVPVLYPDINRLLTTWWTLNRTFLLKNVSAFQNQKASLWDVTEGFRCFIKKRKTVEGKQKDSWRRTNSNRKSITVCVLKRSKGRSYLANRGVARPLNHPLLSVQTWKQRLRKRVQWPLPALLLLNVHPQVVIGKNPETFQFWKLRQVCRLLNT